ncbi:hypothetical protein BO71DRAFT_395177 [Aspergillus ellipticus CBS 707.79]|uniref:Uncharacterized protein n=1 Tax=Aspergillus ellipticus CBS 707.79 TaxID=1448320 RepID=A0A319DM26_9EURO|nr:hypothetical protein BO71DRAFT_395177 [Aspergillus ellipticus CBS 707.79]
MAGIHCVLLVVEGRSYRDRHSLRSGSSKQGRSGVDVGGSQYSMFKSGIRCLYRVLGSFSYIGSSADFKFQNSLAGDIRTTRMGDRVASLIERSDKIEDNTRVLVFAVAQSDTITNIPYPRLDGGMASIMALCKEVDLWPGNSCFSQNIPARLCIT